MKNLSLLCISIFSFCLAECAQGQLRTPGVDLGPRYLAVTFDDGPDPQVTLQILDLLKRYTARATFFPMGSKITGNEAILARMVAEQHAIGNHTLTHRRLSGLNDAQLALELDGVSALLRPIMGETPTMFRPPYSSLDERVLRATRERGMAVILWSMYPERVALLATAESIGNRIVTDARDGDIIFMHDTSQRTVKAMQIAFQGLTAKGFTFVTVPELLNRKGSLKAGEIYERGL